MQLFKRLFPDFKVQKISVNAGFSCPNRDGTIGTGGCIYCDNSSFTPAYCLTGDPVRIQIEKGIRFFSRKYPDMRYLPYFQSFTSTHTGSTERLRAMYDDALSVNGVAGLVIGTRPDTLTPDVARLLGEINRTHPVIVEIGAETSCDATLRAIRRGHTWKDVTDAVALCNENSLHCGLHLIAGLPGKNDDMVIDSVADACRLDIDSIKMHQLQIVKDTPLHHMWLDGQIDVSPYSLDDYLHLCLRIEDTVESIGHGRIEIERFTAQAPPDKVIAPKWGLKNYQFMHKLRAMRESGLQ